MSYMGPSDRNAVMARYRDKLVDCLNGGEMIRAMRNLHAPLGPALDWIDAAATITRLIGYDEIRELVTRASQPERDAIANDHFRTFFVKVCTNATMITALVDLGFPWATARRWALEEGTDTLDLARGLDRGGRLTIPGLTAFLDAARDGRNAAREHLRNLPDADLTALRGGNPVIADIINDSFGGRASEVIRVLNGEIASGEAKVSTSEDLLAGPTTGPFTSMHFGGDHRFDISYDRTSVNVSVGVELTAVDDRARTLLAAAKTTWIGRIQAGVGQPVPAHQRRSHDPAPVQHQPRFRLQPRQRPLGRLGLAEPERRQLVRARRRAGPAQAEAVSQAPVHEFGHLIGNNDEYNRTAEHYVQVTGAGRHQRRRPSETDTAGTTRYTNSLSLMGSGTTIEPRHADSVVDWVNRNLRSGEPEFHVVA